MSSATGEQATPSGGWPTSTFFGSKKELYYNGEGIEVIHVPAAHTDGDSIVFFRRSDVISAGDVFVTTSYPFIDLASGGSYQGIVAAIEKLVDMIIPVYGQDGGTLVIPGHGRISNLGRRLELPRDGHRRRRSHQEHDRGGHDARAGEGREADVRLRPGLWDQSRGG